MGHKACRYALVLGLGLAFGLIIIWPGIASGTQKTSTILKASTLTARYDAVAAAVQGKIYFIGGVTRESEAARFTEEYNPLTDRWSAKAQMPTGRAAAVAVVVDTHIYVLGGRRGNDVLSTVERYDPLSDSWTKRSPMPTSRWLLMASVVAGKVYALGGISGVGSQRRVLDVVEVYDPAKDKWTTIRSMPGPRSNAAVAVLGEKIYIISGRLGAGPTPSTTLRVDEYDTAKSAWRVVRPLEQARTGSEACVLNNKIYVIGGASGGDPTASIEVYDPQTDRWTSGLSLRQPRSAHVCQVVGKSIYVIGGASAPSLSAILTSVEELTPGSLVPAK